MELMNARYMGLGVAFGAAIGAGLGEATGHMARGWGAAQGSVL
jgi:hypothetical protein